MTTSSEPRTGAPRIRYGVLAFGLMGGAAVWLVRLVANAALVAYSCDVGSTWPLWLTSAIATALAGASTAVSWRFHRERGTSETGTLGWLGLLGTMFNVTAIAGIVLETVPVAVLDVCGGLAS